MRCAFIITLAVVMGFSVGLGDARAYPSPEAADSQWSAAPCPSAPADRASKDGFPLVAAAADSSNQGKNGDYQIPTLLASHGFPGAGQNPGDDLPAPPLRREQTIGPVLETIPVALPALLGPADAASVQPDDWQGREEEAGNPIPEPATMVLLGISMISLATYGRFRMKD